MLAFGVFTFNVEIKAQAPLFPNSVVSNDIDFILETDPDVFESLVFLGLADKEMPSSISNELFDEGTFVFEARFSDGGSIEIWCHSSFLTQANAQEYADKLAPRLGKQPSIHRNNIDHVVVHNGNAGAFAEIEGQFFVLYSENMDARISTNDLEETVFHESVHAAYQFMFQNDPAWINAQALDPAFVTEYAEENPQLEDMAESALFAYTFLQYPGRLDSDIEEWLITNNPNRIEFFRMIYGFPTTQNEELHNQRLLIHPNPTSGLVQLEGLNLKFQDRIEILSPTGKLVKSIILGKGQTELNLTSLLNGLYFISIPGYATSKIIKQ